MAIDQKDEKDNDHLHFTTKTAIKTTPCLHNTPQWVLSKVVFKKKRMELKENDHEAQDDNSSKVMTNISQTLMIEEQHQLHQWWHTCIVENKTMI